MSDESWPWVFGSGTGVLGKIGPVPLLLAPIAYRFVRDIVEESHLHCMPNAGVGRMEDTYRFTEERLLKLAGDGKLNLAGHSQPASHYLRFAALHPHKVGTVLSLAGAHLGSELATRPVLKLFGCSKDLAPRSEYLLQVQEEFQDMLQTTPDAVRPEVICYALYRDSIVLPWHSSLVPGAKNRVLAAQKPDQLPHGANWVKTKGQHNHFDVIVSKETLGIIARDVRSQPRRRSKKQPERRGRPRSVTTAKAA